LRHFAQVNSNDTYLKKIGTALKKRRIELNLTLVELEVRTGVNESTISKIEGGKKNITLLTLRKLAEGLESTPSDLLNI